MKFAITSAIDSLTRILLSTSCCISMGAPVYDADTKTYVGMFDARDILSCVTAAHREFLSMGGHHNPGEDTAMPHDVELHHKTQRELMAKALQHIKIDTKPPSPGAVTVSYLAARVSV